MTLTAVPAQQVTWPPGRARAEARRAREHIRNALLEWGLADYSGDVELIVTELVANALRHGTGLVGTRISLDSLGDLRVEVHDDGPGRPHRRGAAPDAESGRGLAVVDGLLALHDGSFDVSDDEHGDGKTVHAMLCLGTPRAGERAARPGPESQDRVRVHA
jgi:signal transduction histidine kinase